MTVVFNLTPEMNDKLEHQWWRLMQGELGLDYDPALKEIVEKILAYIPDQMFDKHAAFIVDQFDDSGPIEVMTEDEIARRIVSALATILYGGGP